MWIKRGLYTLQSISLALLLAAEAPAAEHTSYETPLDIGSRLELFVDDFLVDTLEGVEHKLHSPRSAGTVLAFDKPWEGVTSGNSVGVFQDGEIYRMYYRGSSHAGYALESLLQPGEKVIAEHPYGACYAESRDGIHWTRPSLGIVEFQGSKDNNIVWTGRGAGAFLPFKDPNPAASAQERYKAVGPDSGALYAFVSPDAIHWQEMQEKPIITDGAFDSPNLAFWDTVQQRYVCVYRDFINGVRTIKIATSSDFRNWTPGQWGEFGDAPSEHLYTNATRPYFRAPHIYLAFPRRFHPWKTMGPFNQAHAGGCSDAIFMSSRDTVHWNRYLEAFIRPGPDVRNWSHRSNTPAWGLLATAPDEISLFVERHYTFPSNHLERMVIRTDGFVSVHADYAGGELRTRPLIFQGENLILNFATSAAGSIRVEIQDVEGNPLPGFGLEDSPLIWGDQIEQTVTWERTHAKATSDKPLARIAGKPVRLRFVMKDADLYSLRFK